MSTIDDDCWSAVAARDEEIVGEVVGMKKGRLRKRREKRQGGLLWSCPESR